MKVLNAAEMRAVDHGTFAALGISSRTVMENAGRAVAEIILGRYPFRRNCIVFCGAGNNGGDGLVIARALKNFGWSATVVLVQPISKFTDDSRANYHSWIQVGGETIEFESRNWGDIQAKLERVKSPVYIDAIFGTGFRGSLPSDESEVVAWINQGRKDREAFTVSVDIPSGIAVDSGIVGGLAIEADLTVALQFPKIAHLVFPAARNSGEVMVADIGLWNEFPALKSVRRELIEPEMIASILQPVMARDLDTHKGRRGHVLVVGGSVGTYGAPFLSARAALRAGAGLVTVSLPREIAIQFVTEIGELMTLPFEVDEGGELIGGFQSAVAQFLSERLSPAQGSVVIGPGLGLSKGAATILSAVLEGAHAAQIPVVLDADGLTLLSRDKTLWRFIDERCLLTPHPGEMSSLTGRPTAEIQADRVNLCAEFSKAHRCWVNLKGARSIIGGPEGEIFINPAADEALATAGSGDVLAGIAGMLLARGISIGESTVASAYLHGIAGVRLGARHRGVVASDLMVEIPQAIFELGTPPVLKRPPTPWRPVVSNY